MYVVMVAAECAPAAKAGGLGDVVAGLSRELEQLGHDVEVIVPKYASLRYSEVRDLQPAHRDLPVPWYEGTVRCTVVRVHRRPPVLVHRPGPGGGVLRPGPAVRVRR
jgi:starch synthase